MHNRRWTISSCYMIQESYEAIDEIINYEIFMYAKNKISNVFSPLNVVN